jgi:N utilization substance protein B
MIDENKNRYILRKDDLNPNMKFANNLLLLRLSENKKLQSELEKRKISWQGDMDVVRKLFNEIKTSELYLEYLNKNETTIHDDRNFVVTLVANYLSENELIISLFEEKNIHWADDTFVAFNSVIRNLEDFNGQFEMQALLKDEADDLQFMRNLFNKTIMYKSQFDELIDAHTKNWELERIANMDMLLMQMALAEILYIPSVPVKASLNEYIDISKEYSTPNSKVFVNGVLDKIIIQLRRENKIIKQGRGLKEN